MSKPIRLGLVGTGIAARELHWPALKNLKDSFSIAAVCNRNIDKAESFSQMIGGTQVYSDYREMFRNAELDAVDILLPIEQNLEACTAAVNAGLHVIAEKPIASNLEQAEKMLALEVAHPKQVMMIAENFRYKKTFDRLKELKDNGSIGKPYFVAWNAFQRMTLDNKYAKTPWRIDHKYEGGFLTDGGVHNIAALRDLLGDLTIARSTVKSINPAIGKSDTLSLSFEAGSVSGLVNLFFSAHGPYESRLTVYGSEGTLTVEGENLLLWKGDDVPVKETFPGDNGFQAEFEDFYHCVKSASKPRGSLREAYEDLKTMLAILHGA